MGPGTPTPVTYSPRPIGKGKQLSYNGKAGTVQADVGKGVQGTNNNASFQPRPPVRSPGVSGGFGSGSFVDTKA